jgi:hypothetical protein
MQMAEKKVWAQRSERAAMRRQSGEHVLDLVALAAERLRPRQRGKANFAPG